MFSIWWPAFIVPVLMVLRCLIPWIHYTSPRGDLGPEEQQFADEQQRQLLWRFAFVFAALAVMLMRSVTMVAENVQNRLVIGIVVLQAVGAVLTFMPIERMLKLQFGEKEEGDAT